VETNEGQWSLFFPVAFILACMDPVGYSFTLLTDVFLNVLSVSEGFSFGGQIKTV